MAIIIMQGIRKNGFLFIIFSFGDLRELPLKK